MVINASGEWYREPLSKVGPGNGTRLGCRSGTAGNRCKSEGGRAECLVPSGCPASAP